MAKLNVPAQDLQAAFADIASSGFMTEGKYVKLFEAEVEAWSGMYAVAMNSAGTGLYSMVRCMGLPGKEAIVSDNTFFATGGMTKEAGMDVVLADCTREDFCLSKDTVMGRLTRNTKLVVLTHVGGGLAQGYMELSRFCRDAGIALIEDAAHALGVGDGRNSLIAGSQSMGAVFSLYPTKAIPAGDGGVVVTKDKDFAEDLKRFRNYGKHVVNGVIQYTGQGFNFRMDEWTAAVSYLQMKRRREIVADRERQAARLRKIVTPLVDWQGGQSNWYKYIAPRSFGAVKKTGQVYAWSDQMNVAMGLGGVFENSKWVADNHDCLPLDEGLYDNMSDEQIVAFLKGENQ